MEFDVNKLKQVVHLMTYEANAKRREKSPTTTISVPSDVEININDVMVGLNNRYTVGIINFRRPSSMTGRDIVSFESTT